MNFNQEIFNDLKEYLIAWRPKNTLPTRGGVGFNEYNVLDIEGTLPTGNPFDFVYFGFPSKQETPVTTGSRRIQESTQTFTVDMYCKRVGTGTAMKRATKYACEENTEKIVEFFVRRGFTVTMPIPDLNYSGDSTARQPMYFTKTFRRS